MIASADGREPRFVRFEISSFLSEFGGHTREEVWINPRQVASVERFNAKASNIYLSNGRSHTVDGAVEETIRKLSR